MTYQQQQQQHATVTALLKKTSHYDKDERYMATSDLCELLKRHQCASQDTTTTTSTTTSTSTTMTVNNNNNNAGNLTTTTTTASSAYLDAATEREICTTVLRLLHDKSHDVQAVAVKTLGVLLTAVQEEQVLEIADSLADQVLDASKSELRDVYAIGLRTLVKTCPVQMGQAVSLRLLSRLLDGIRSSSNVSSSSSSSSTTTTASKATSSATTSATATNKNNREEIVLACLDVLTDLLGRFGSTAKAVTRQHEPILQLCLQLLSSSSSSSNNSTSTTTSAAAAAAAAAANTVADGSGTTSEVVRKRAGNTLACLSTVLSDTLVQRMVEALLRQIDVASTTAGSNSNSVTTTRSKTTSAATTSSSSMSGVADTRSLIRTMCAVSGAVGHRLGQTQIDRILPIFLRFTRPEGAVTGNDDDDDDDNNNNKNDDNDDDNAEAFHDSNNKNHSEAESTEATALANELRESCFMGFESFVLRCPVEVEPHLESIITAALAYMSYDPNYSYGRQEEDGDAAIEPDNEEDVEEEEDDDDYEDEDEAEDDDDDESWKVRRSAIRALCAVVETRKHNPTTLWTVPYSVRRGKAPVQVSRALVQRFKEREENCRVGVIECFNRLLSVTIEAGQPLLTTSDDMITTDSNTIDWQADYAPGLVKACETILAVKKGNDRSKSAALALLATLCKAPGGVGGASEIASVFQHVQTFLSVDPTNETMLHRGGEGTSKALRLDALSLVHALLESNTHDPVHIRTSLRKWMLPELCQAVQEQWYKVIAEALRALSEVPRFFVLGYKESDDPVTKETERKEVSTQLYAAIEPLLAAHDVDQEIKECALKACASLLSSLHSSLTVEQKTRLLSLLLDRLTNETTRIAAIKTVASVAGSKSGCSLSPILAESIAAMASFLKLSSRSLKQSSLEALDIVVINHGSDPAANEELYAIVLQELAPLITDRDLHLSHLSLCATVSILRACPAAGPAVNSYVLEPALFLSTSSLLQDNALDSLLELFKQMILSKAIDFQELLTILQARLTTRMVGKHGIYNLAKCIAVITANTTQENCRDVLDKIFKLLDGSNTPTESSALPQVQLSLLITGDLGRMIDLSIHDGAPGRLKTIYLGYFESLSEDLKNAAAYALGNATVGSPSAFLQAIVGKLDEDNKKQQYLLLSALREFIQCSARKSSGSQDMASCLSVIIPTLERHCSDEEEGVRTMVAECLGSLTCLQPEVMLKKLEEIQLAHSAIAASDGVVAEEDIESTNNALVCWTVASSVKLAIAGKVDSSQLATFMPTFVKLLKQDELHVRNAALLMVYSAVHHMPNVVADLMNDSIMPSLFEVANLKLERKVDLGPFKHTVDDALPLRKAALSIFATCLENIPSSLDISEFMPVLANALGDAEDIQLHAYQIIISMCARQPTYIIASLDAFMDPLEKTINKKPGQKTGTELERLNDWIKSAVRVMFTLSKLEGAQNSRKFLDFVERVKGNTKFVAQLSALEDEH